MASIRDALDGLLALNKQRVKVGDTKTIGIPAGDTVTPGVDLGDYFPFLQVEIPTITSAQLELQVSNNLDGAYQDMGVDVLTAAGTGGYNDTWILGGWRYIKIKSSAAQTNAVAFTVRGITY